MMKPASRNILLFTILIFNSVLLKSQQPETTYFMENMPLRHEINPAFQPHARFYLSFPVIGYTGLEIGDNAISLQDIIYNKNGKTTLFSDTPEDMNAFFNKLKPTLLINSDLKVNLISVGYRTFRTFMNFTVNQRLENSVSFPKDLLKLPFYGTPGLTTSEHNLNLYSTTNYYTELAFGLSYTLSKRWAFGGKIKYLYGIAGISNVNDYITLNTSIDELRLKAKGNINYSGNFNSFANYYNNRTFTIDKPSGNGAGIDLGFQYRFSRSLSISAAITNLGFIKWTKNTGNSQFVSDYTFNGVADFNSKMSLATLNSTVSKLTNVNYISDSLSNAFVNSINIVQTNKSFTTRTTAKINIGAEYKILHNTIAFGILYSELYQPYSTMRELTASVNLLPFEWFNASLSYSAINGSKNIGLGAGVRTGFLHWFVALDYVPFKGTSVGPIVADKIEIKSLYIPYQLNTYNIAAGVSFVINPKNRKYLPEEDTGEHYFDTRNGLYNSTFNTNDCHCTHYKKQ